MTHSPKIADCLKVVEEAFGVTRGDLLSARRGREVARPRQVAYWLAKKVTLHSLPEIGRAIGGRDHTTIMAGVKRVDVVCPGFTGDCLETLEEIAMEGRHAVLESGGKEFHYIPCLNDDPTWISALCDVAQQHLSGWPTQAPPSAQELQDSKQRAQALGAKD